MQGKPMTPLSASMHGVATREQQATMAADVVLLTAEKGRLLARLASYEAALRLCEEELSVLLHAAQLRCGDPDYECPMQDAHKPNDSFQIALQAARKALEDE